MQKQTSAVQKKRRSQQRSHSSRHRTGSRSLSFHLVRSCWLGMVLRLPRFRRLSLQHSYSHVQTKPTDHRVNWTPRQADQWLLASYARQKVKLDPVNWVESSILRFCVLVWAFMGCAAASSLSLAVCTLRRRLPPLEEMFLDEECAMYTSRRQSWPSQPRCLNPVASTLLFQDSTVSCCHSYTIMSVVFERPGTWTCGISLKMFSPLHPKDVISSPD